MLTCIAAADAGAGVPDTAAGTPPAQAAAADTPAAAAPAIPAIVVKTDCLAGCNDGSRRAKASGMAPHSLAATRAPSPATGAPKVEDDAGSVCLAGCGTSVSRQQASTVQSQSEVRATSDQQAARTVKVLRGSTRTKVYRVDN